MNRLARERCQPPAFLLTHWGWVSHICVSKLTIIGSDNGLSPGRRKAIIWTNAGILLIRPLGTNFSEILIEIYTFLFKKIIWKCRLEMAAMLSRPQWVKISVRQRAIAATVTWHIKPKLARTSYIYIQGSVPYKWTISLIPCKPKRSQFVKGFVVIIYSACVG